MRLVFSQENFDAEYCGYMAHLLDEMNVYNIPIFLKSIKFRQSWTKVLRQFRKSNAFKQRTEFCTWTKTSFSSVITPSPPKQCCKMLRRCLFVSNTDNGERGGYFSRRDRAEFARRKKGSNFNVSQQLLPMIVAREIHVTFGKIIC